MWTLKRPGTGVTKSRRGSALALSLGVIALISALGVGIVQLQAALDKRQTVASDRRSALYVAEAGIAEATLAVSQGRSGNVASEAVPARIGDSVYWVEAEQLSGGRIRLVSQAASGTRRFAIQAIVMPKVSPIGEYGFFGDEGVEVGWGAVVDGFDSSEGSYSAQVDPSYPFLTTGEGAEVYSNGDIIFADSPVDSPQRPGPGTGGRVPPIIVPEDDDDAEGGGGIGPASIDYPIWEAISRGGFDPSGEFSVVSSGEGLSDRLPLFSGNPKGLVNDLRSVLLLQGLGGFAQDTFTMMRAGGNSVELTAAEYVYLRHLNATGSSPSETEARMTFSPGASRLLETAALLKQGIDPDSLAADGVLLDDVIVIDLPNEGGWPNSGGDVGLSIERGLGGSVGGSVGRPDRAYVFGEAVPGEDSYVASSGAPYIEESSSALSENLVMPRVVIPEGLVAEAGIRTIAAGSNEVIGREDRWIDGIVVEAGATLTIEGPTILAVATLDVLPNGRVVFDDSEGPIRLYATDRLGFAVDSIIDSVALEEHALGTHIMIGGRSGATPGGRVELLASGRFHGLLYAPEDDVLIPNSLRFIGSAAAKRLSIQDYAHATYDLAFATSGEGVPSLPKILSWQVVTIEEGEVTQLRFNPVLALAAKGITPVASSSAAIETDFEVVYLGTDGALQSYTGAAASFDWGQVDRLTSLRWLNPDGSTREWNVPSGYDPELILQTFREDERLRIYGKSVALHPSGADAEAPTIIGPDGRKAMGTVPDVEVAIAVPGGELDGAGPGGEGPGDTTPEGGSDPAGEPGGGGAGSEEGTPSSGPEAVHGTPGESGPGGVLSEASGGAPTDPGAGPLDAPDPNVRSVRGMGDIELAVATLQGKAMDYDGDGRAFPVVAELDGQTLIVKPLDAVNEVSAADFQAMLNRWGLQEDANGNFSKPLGPLAALVEAIIEPPSLTGGLSGLFSGLFR